MFSGGREWVHWERMGLVDSLVWIKNYLRLVLATLFSQYFTICVVTDSLCLDNFLLPMNIMKKTTFKNTFVAFAVPIRIIKIS